MKTKVKIDQDVNESMLRKDDIGYIDGYVTAADGRPYAVVVIPSTNVIDMCPLNLLTALVLE